MVGEAERPVRRAVAVVVLGLGVAAGAAAITILSLIMRSVTAIGGSCADGGPYVSAQPCPTGTGTALLLVFACTLTCLIGTLWAASVLKAPIPLLLAWPAIFLTLGWNFLEDGFDPPDGQGVVTGFVVCGVLFVLMGGAPLLLWLSVVRDARRTRRAHAGFPSSPRRPYRRRGAPRPSSLTGSPARPGRRPARLGHVGRRAAGAAGRSARLRRADRRRDAQAKKATLQEELDR